MKYMMIIQFLVFMKISPDTNKLIINNPLFCHSKPRNKKKCDGKQQQRMF